MSLEGWRTPQRHAPESVRPETAVNTGGVYRKGGGGGRFRRPARDLEFHRGTPKRGWE